MGVPQNGWFTAENLIKIGDFGVPPIQETPKIKFFAAPSAVTLPFTPITEQQQFNSVNRCAAWAGSSNLSPPPWLLLNAMISIAYYNKGHRGSKHIQQWAYQ